MQGRDSDLADFRGIRFCCHEEMLPVIVIAEVYDGPRNGKVTHGEIAVLSMSCQAGMKTTSFALPRRHAGREQQDLRRVLPSTAGLQSIIKARAEIGEDRCDVWGSSAPFHVSQDP